MTRKIAVHKKKLVKPIAQVRVGAIKRPQKVIKTKTVEVVKKKPQTVVIPKRQRSVREQNVVRVQRSVEAVKQGKRQVVRLNNKIKKDANYRKIQDIKNVGLNRILVMIACGPSVLENDFSILNDIDNLDIMVINKPLPSVWPPKYWAFCDDSQRKRNESHFKSYQGTLINSTVVKERKPNQVVVLPKAITGVSRNLHEGYVIGRSSVYANIQVALWMNYKKIFIFGVDMCQVQGKLHHYGVNPDVAENKRLKRFGDEATNYNIMATKLPEDIRKNIYFCSSYNPWPFVDKFNKWDHNGAIDKIIDISKSISSS